MTKGRVDRLVSLISSSIILLLLAVSTYTIYHFGKALGNDSSNLLPAMFVLVATLVFPAVLSMGTMAKRHEVVCASAV